MSMMSAFLEWDGEEFVQMAVSKDTIDDPKKTMLFIDENTRTIIFRMGNEVQAFDKRIISRRFQSISKSGINLGGVQLGIGYNVIEHMGEMDIKGLIKDPEKGISSLGDTALSTSPTYSTRPISAEKAFDGGDALTGHNKEAFELGIKILKHIENNRMVIIDTDKTIRAYTKFL